MLVVLFAGGFQVEIDQGDLATVPRRQIVNGLTENRVVRNLKGPAVFEDEQGRRQRRIGIDRRRFFDVGSVLGWVSRCGGFDWRYIRLRTRSTSIENSGSALLVGGFFGLCRLIFYGRIVNGVRDWNRIPDGADGISVVVLVVVIVMMIATIVNGRGPFKGMVVRGIVTLGSDGSDAGARTINGIPSETGGSYRRGRAIDLTDGRED